MESQGRTITGYKAVSLRRVHGTLRAYSALSAMSETVGIPLALEYGDFWTKGMFGSPVFAFDSYDHAWSFIKGHSDLIVVEAQLKNAELTRDMQDFWLLTAGRIGNLMLEGMPSRTISEVRSWWNLCGSSTDNVTLHLANVRARIKSFWRNPRPSDNEFRASSIPAGTLACEAIRLPYNWQNSVGYGNVVVGE